MVNTLFGYRIDFWTFWGFSAQFLFLLSFIVQWYKSEKLGRSYLPEDFWWIRLLASLMLLIYVLQRKDIVFLVAVLLQIIIYYRNIYLIRKGR
jgi:lipid-A-disaccharide synthase-like uncharacterized protein